MPKLHFIQPEFATLSCDLPEGNTTVGRSSKNTLVLNDPSVSAMHCEVVVSWNEVILRDPGSSNGTWVAGARVKGQLHASHGDLIRFGGVEARLAMDAFPDGDATAVTANFAASRAKRDEADPASFRKIFGKEPVGDDTRNPTISVPEPVSAKPKAVDAPVPSSSAKSAESSGSSARWWIAGAVALGVLTLAAVWLIRTSR